MRSHSAVCRLALMASRAAMDLLIRLFPLGGRAYPPTLRSTHPLHTVVGLAAVRCMRRTGVPAAWDAVKEDEWGARHSDRARKVPRGGHRSVLAENEVEYERE